PIPDELVTKSRKRGIPAAGVRHDEHSGLAETLRLRPGATRRPRTHEASIHGDADERHHARTQPSDLSGESPPTLLVLGGRHLGGRARRARNYVRRGDPELR